MQLLFFLGGFVYHRALSSQKVFNVQQLGSEAHPGKRNHITVGLAPGAKPEVRMIELFGCHVRSKRTKKDSASLGSRIRERSKAT